MGILDQGIDWSAVEAGGSNMDSGPLPAGEWTVEAVSFEERTSNAGNIYLAFDFKVLGPTHANMHVWENFTITGESKVGMARLKSFIGATGVDTNQPLGTALVNSAMQKPLNVITEIEAGRPNPNGGMYKDKARITSFKPPQNVAHQQQQAVPAAQPAPQPAPTQQVQTNNWSA